jgi:ketosteroid isomerase-like protein
MKPHYVGMMFVCAIACISVVSAARTAAASDAEIGAEIRMLEEQEVRAVLAHDAATLERLWDKAYVVHNPEGRIVPAAASVTARPVFQNARAAFVREVESIVVNGDVAFSMGSETVTSIAAPSKAGDVVKRRYTNIWIRKNGVWRLAARHANKICSRE